MTIVQATATGQRQFCGYRRSNGLAPKEVEIIRIGGRLHDIGKIETPDAVLQKPGKLTHNACTLIRRHPQIGKKILERVERFREYLPIVELHHENYDGGGPGPLP